MPLKVALDTKRQGVPRSTLFDRITKEKTSHKGSQKGMGFFKPVFNNEQEAQLEKYLLEMEEQLFGFTGKDVKEMAFQLAEKNNLTHPFTNQETGQDWLLGFLKRHPKLSLRTPEATSAARARGFNRNNVESFFSLHEELMN